MGLLTRLRATCLRWLGHLQSAPALATLLVGVGFLVGNFMHRYQVAHQPKTASGDADAADQRGVIANVTGIVQTPNSELVQVNYNRVVPETVEGRWMTRRFASC